MIWSTKWEDTPVSDNAPKELITKEDIENYIENTPVFDPPDTTDYSNPNLILTFTCDDCGQLFDCKTTKFGVLCDSAILVGWKMKWKDQGYDVYCPQCKEDVK